MKKIDLNRSAEAERLVSAGRVDDDAAFELKLRPSKLSEFIGQSKAKEQLAIALEAAKSRGEALDHVLLFGPPGLGKTTLATIIANELDVGFQQSSGPALVIRGFSPRWRCMRWPSPSVSASPSRLRFCSADDGSMRPWAAVAARSPRR